MRTLIVSDLHLGSASRTDLLSRAHVRARLLEAAAGVDRVVLLGDSLELRHGPPRDALALARPFFEGLGRVLAGAEIVVVAGNHDHALIAPWFARRSENARPGPLALENIIAAADASPMLAHLADAAAPARVVAAYPGLWVRDDVYATHGHYLDCHLTLPTLERLSVGVMARLLRRPADEFSSADDYEAVTAPLYAWRQAVAQNARTGNILNGTATVEVWRALSRSHSGSQRSPRSQNGARPAAGTFSRAQRALRRRALVAAFPLAVAALNRAGVGPLRTEVSASELRRAGLRAMADVSRRLGLDGCYVIFGHTHRAGPLPGDQDPQWARLSDAEPAAARLVDVDTAAARVDDAECAAARVDDAEPPAEPGARLVNSGCWTYDAAFLTARPGESPYWPGTCVVVEDSGAPVIERLLLDHTHEQLRAIA